MTVGTAGRLVRMTALLCPAACLQKPHAEQTAVSSDRFSAQGRVEGLSDAVDVSAAVSGRIERVLVDEGDVVAAGALLAELDCQPLRAEAAHREAELAVARANQTRLHRGSRTEEREEALARVRAAEVRAERAKLDRQRARHRQGPGGSDRQHPRGRARSGGPWQDRAHRPSHGTEKSLQRRTAGQVRQGRARGDRRARTVRRQETADRFAGHGVLRNDAPLTAPGRHPLTHPLSIDSATEKDTPRNFEE